MIAEVSKILLVAEYEDLEEDVPGGDKVRCWC
jgi:hypothetical protein